MSKKVKRYNEGGDIVVTGRKSPMNSFDLARMSGSSGLLGGGMGGVSSGGGGGYGGSNAGQTRTQLPVGKTAGYVGPTIRGDNYKVSAGLGPRGAIGIGGKIGFKKGGKVSTASKRADGCATKGKTKGRFV